MTRHRTAHRILAAGCAALGAALAAIVLFEPRGSGLAGLVGGRLDDAAVPSAVTAVLLDFRSYDTLLEVAVLVAAVVAIWSLERDRPALPPPLDPRAEPVLMMLARTIVPLIILVAIHLVWLGARAPGGAFQGGALAAGAVVLVLAAGIAPIDDRARRRIKYLITLGLAAFLLAAVVTLAWSGTTLAYPRGTGYAWVLFIEVCVALSIAVVLADLFVDVPSVADRGEVPRDT